MSTVRTVTRAAERQLPGGPTCLRGPLLLPALALALATACGEEREAPEEAPASTDQSVQSQSPATTGAAAPEPAQAPRQEATPAPAPSQAPEPTSATPEMVQAPASVPAARPAAPSTDQDAATLARADLAVTARLAAAERLLLANRRQLVAAYDDRAAVPIIRQLIETRIAASDTSVLPLVVDLFKARGGEERIDFEAYLLAFGRAAEDELVGLLSSSDVSLVMRAVDTLAKTKATVAADTVASLLRHPDSWVRISAAHALGEIAAPGAADVLLSALEDTAYAVVNAGLVSLGRLRAPELYEPAMRLVGSDNPHVRKHAAMALGQLGDGRAQGVLEKLSEGDTDSGVRFMAKQALKRMAAQQGGG